MSEHPITFIGITDFRSKQTMFGIKAKDRLQHMYVIGKTGVGKSTLLQNMAISDIQNGNGICVIDPHGDLAESLLDYVPASRIHDVIYFNANDSMHPIAFNPLFNIAPEKHDLVVSTIISSCKAMWNWGPRLEHIFKNCLLTLLASNQSPTLLDVQPLLVNKGFRERLLYRISDSDVLSFWYDEFNTYTPAHKVESISPILNKVGIFSSNKLLRNIFGQQHSSIDIHDIINNKRILIANLSKGIVGEDVTNVLGSMLVAAIHFAAMQRAEVLLENRIPFYLYVDEIHSFVSLAFINILSEARKYGLGVFLTNQYLEQLDKEIRTAIFGNVGSIISFRVGAEDAKYIAQEFYPVFTQTDFINLPPYSMYLKLMIDGVSSKPFSAKSLLLKLTSQSYKAEIIERSRAVYSNSNVTISRVSNQARNVDQATLF